MELVSGQCGRVSVEEPFQQSALRLWQSVVTLRSIAQQVLTRVATNTTHINIKKPYGSTLYFTYSMSNIHLALALKL